MLPDRLLADRSRIAAAHTSILTEGDTAVGKLFGKHFQTLEQALGTTLALQLREEIEQFDYSEALGRLRQCLGDGRPG